MSSLFQKYQFYFEFQMETFPLGNNAEMKIGNYVERPTYVLPFPHLSPSIWRIIIMKMKANKRLHISE